MSTLIMTDADFARLVLFVCQNFGINLEKKRTLVEARLSFDIANRGFSSFKEYLNAVTSDLSGIECTHMLNKLSTNYTFFFRESASLDFAVNKFVPEFISAGGKHLNIWCAACAGGQEPYSLAMMLECLPSVRLGTLEYTIFATDVNTDLLEKAKVGRYPKDKLDNIPAAYHKFVLIYDTYIQMNSHVMKHIRWNYENLLQTTYLNCWDLILCRNVIIYFKADTRHELANKLYNALRPNGCLILGATESIDIDRVLFDHREPSVYRKKAK